MVVILLAASPAILSKTEALPKAMTALSRKNATDVMLPVHFHRNICAAANPH